MQFSLRYVFLLTAMVAAFSLLVMWSPWFILVLPWPLLAISAAQKDDTKAVFWFLLAMGSIPFFLVLQLVQ